MAVFWSDEKRNLLIYPASPEFPTSHLTDAKMLNGAYYAVPASLRNSQILSYYNYPVAPLITDSSYDWPAAPEVVPWANQKLASNFMVLHPHCFNLSDMGTGKTLSCLWAADWLMRRNKNFKVLIICPLSIMERVWGDAIWKNFLSKRTYEVIHGSAAKREKIIQSSQADFFIVNFDGVGVGAHRDLRLDGFAKALSERNDIRLTIIDEASGYRDARTRRSRLAKKIIGQCPFLWLLTGTPTPNAPTDAYGLARLVNNAQGKSFTTFKLETMARVSQWKWVPQPDGYEKARKLLQPAIRFDLQDVWDGPEITTQQREVSLTSEQVLLLKELKKSLIIKLKEGLLISVDTEIAVRTKFLQICLGAVYDKEHSSHRMDSKPRLDVLKETIQEATGKIIVFSPLTSVIHLVYDNLKNAYSCEKIHGEIPKSQRDGIFQSFQQGESPRVLIADPGTMAHGLDLYAADTVIWYGPVDKTEQYLQGNARAYRPGQKYPVTVVQIVSTAVEREIFRRIERRISIQGLMLDAIKEGLF